MSEENVELVRNWFRAISRTLSAYSENPGPVADAPFIEDVFALLDDDVEWSWPLSSDTFRGRAGMLQGAIDFLDAVDDWQIEIAEVLDAGERVFAHQRVSAQGKGSGVPFHQEIYTVFTFRDRRILRMEDHVEREEALKAAGLSE